MKNKAARVKQQKRRHVPKRTCRGCGRKAAKYELVRFVRVNGEIIEDVTRILDGRGVYCCANDECRQRLKKNRKVLNRALRLQG